MGAERTLKRMVERAQFANAKMIEGDDAVRARKCLQEIERILAAYDCALLPLVLLKPGGFEFGVDIKPNPRLTAQEQEDARRLLQEGQGQQSGA